MDMVLSAHSGIRWLVLVGLIAVLIWAFSAGGDGDVPSWVTIVKWLFRIQVLLGLILYVFDQGWDLGTFIAFFHPVAMVAALAVFEAGSGRAAKEHNPRMLGVFTIVSLVLILAGIPWDRGMM